MKASVIERLARTHLLPVLPGFVVGRSLLYRRPVDYFLPGLSFDTLSFSSSRVFVEAFIQPLYERYDYLIYTYGFRLGDDFWDVDEQDPTRPSPRSPERRVATRCRSSTRSPTSTISARSCPNGRRRSR